MEDGRFPETVESNSQKSIFESYAHSLKAASFWGEDPKIYLKKNLMLNLKNNENDAVFDEICKKSED